MVPERCHSHRTRKGVAEMCFKLFRKRPAHDPKAPPLEPQDPEYQELDDIMMYSVITQKDPEDLFDQGGK